MGRYITRRLLQAIPMMFLISIILFTLVNIAPGGPMAGLSRRRPKPAQIEMLKRQFGLDKPLPVQYVVWLIGNDWMRVDADGDGIAESYGERRGTLPLSLPTIPRHRICPTGCSRHPGSIPSAPTHWDEIYSPVFSTVGASLYLWA